MEELKLVALDNDDIEVISAHVQDARVKAADVRWQPRERRFVMALNRFDWMNAADGQDATGGKSPDYRRCRTALRFERVNACKCRGLDPSNKDALLNLLAVEFTEGDSPAGTVTLTFSGGGAIRLAGGMFRGGACRSRRGLCGGVVPGSFRRRYRHGADHAARGCGAGRTAKSFMSTAMTASVAV